MRWCLLFLSLILLSLSRASSRTVHPKMASLKKPATPALNRSQSTRRLRRPRRRRRPHYTEYQLYSFADQIENISFLDESEIVEFRCGPRLDVFTAAGPPVQVSNIETPQLTVTKKANHNKTSPPPTPLNETSFFTPPLSVIAVAGPNSTCLCDLVPRLVPLFGRLCTSPKQRNDVETRWRK
jgi:hypothetical protein